MMGCLTTARSFLRLRTHSSLGWTIRLLQYACSQLVPQPPGRGPSAWARSVYMVKSTFDAIDLNTQIAAT